MKKILAIIFFVMIVGTLLVSCGKEDKTEKTSTTSETSVVKDGKYSSVKEWIKNESEQIKTMKESMAINDLSINVTHDGNSLVYQCRLNELSKEDVTEEMRGQLDKDMEKQNVSLQTVLKMLKNDVPNAEGIIYEYYDRDGDLISKYEIK